MRIGVLGTGVVGRTLGTGLIGLGHGVMMGARSAGGERAREWVSEAGPPAREGSFADAAAFGDLVLNCTEGAHSVAALTMAGAANLASKVLVDVANPLDFATGMPPTLTVANDDSLAERIQRAFPEARVVKALNTMSCAVMIDPGSVPGEHDTFVCGDDPAAKREVEGLLASLGWPAARIRDLGGIRSARGLEMYLPLWLDLMRTLGTTRFNIAISVAPD